MVYYRENDTFSRIQRGSNIFRGGGGPTFSRGVQMLSSIEPISLVIFQGGGPDHLSPLLIRT